MKHDDNISKKTILTLYLSLSILFTFILCVESSVNVTANVTANVTITTNSTDDKSSASPSPSPFDERTVTIIIYFIITLMIGIPILTFLACIYHTKGSAPCDFKEAFCNCC